MFIKYQTVRNTVLGGIVCSVVGAFILGRVMPRPTIQSPTPVTSTAPVEPGSGSHAMESHTAVPVAASQAEVDQVSEADSVVLSGDVHVAAANAEREQLSADPVTEDLTRYRRAMAVALAAADPSGKGKDVLGSGSPWKLNLYDDDRDGHWDRGKLDRDRDDNDDEKWNFKQGRWEKDGGRTLWIGDRWVAADDNERVPPRVSKPTSPDPRIAQYRQAMRIALRPADRSGKGKDVLGPGSPWKLNLYDDDLDGQWDRGKLDYDRDDVDDEKWTFKNGRWEKGDGQLIWQGDAWVDSGK